MKKFDSAHCDSLIELNRKSQNERRQRLKENHKRYKTIDDVYNAIGSDFSKEQANEIINSLNICAPAVGWAIFW